jgi:hypothetical protein
VEPAFDFDVFDDESVARTRPAFDNAAEEGLLDFPDFPAFVILCSDA